MGNLLPPKQITKWYPLGGKGYITSSDSGDITTLSGIPLVTLSGVNLIVNVNIYTPKATTTWTKTAKNTTSWRPLGGNGYIATQGTLLFTDNLGNFIVDNSGNNIVTTPTYVTPKNVTIWTASGS